MGKCPRITENEEISRIVHCELDINKGPFTSDEIDKAVKCIINGKAVGLDEIPAEDILLHFCNSVYNHDPRDGTNDVYYRFQNNET